ncbi:MAG: S-layer homology domain-containing protein [Clostridia bacterium]|nr:S-layer homology domain-containing protein [Clostridia bacterium]
MKRSIALLLLAALLAAAVPAAAFAAETPMLISTQETVKYGYKTETYTEMDRSYREQGLTVKISIPYYLGTINEKIDTRLGEAESDILVLYVPSSKWDGNNFYGAVSATLTTRGIKVYSGSDSVVAWKDLYNYGFLDVNGGLYTFDGSSMQMHFTAGPGLYTALAAIPFGSTDSPYTRYEDAYAAAVEKGEELDYAAVGADFILVLDDETIDTFMENGTLDKVSSFKWPGLKELLLKTRYTMEEGSAEGLQNFETKNFYLRGQFLDMPYRIQNWYDSYVARCYNLNLINGYPDGTFRPQGNITVAECLAIACVMHDIYIGGNGLFPAGASPWYNMYVSYALANGIIMEGDVDDYNAPATRAQVSYIFTNALPDAVFAEVKNSFEFTDVTGATPYFSGISKLAKAGIIGGYPDGTFRPDNFITRAEACVIMTNIVDGDKRK